MEERTSRELAFCYIYSQEIQKQNSRNQVKLFLDCNDIEDIKTREYVKDIAGGIKQNEEEIEKIISENLKKGWTNPSFKIRQFYAVCTNNPCFHRPGLQTT